MKAHYKLETKYYKYQYNEWVQPVLTSNTSSEDWRFIDPQLSGGTVNDSTGVMTWGSAAAGQFVNIYKSFNSTTTDYWTVNAGSRTFTVFDILFNNPIKLKQVYIKGTVVSGAASSLTGSQIYNVKPTGESELLSTTADYNENTHIIEDVIVSRLRICLRPNSDGNKYPSRITAITITAQEQTVIESSKSDYDFYEYIDVCSLPTKQVPIYEKYDYEYLNTLPTYANAAEGGAGINGISFSPSAMYFCVAQTKQSTVTNSLDYKVVWDFGGREFKLNTCTYQNYVVNLRTPAASLKTIEGSNDGTNWTTVTAPVATYYKFYRFKFSGSETNKYGAMGMKYFNLTGSLRKKVVSTNGQPVEYVTQYLGIL